jgi:hypothetical protein
MSTDNAPVTYPQPPAPAQAPPGGPRPWFTSRDLGPAAAILAALAAAGAVLGLIWQAISPRTKGFVYLPNAVIPEENESLIAADGRFLLLTGAVGIVAAVAAWLRKPARGPATAVALVAGGLLGALLTDFVGRLVGGGHSTGALNAVVTLPLRVHARGLLLVEPAIAAFVYAACALFARRDDLGVPAEKTDPGAAKLLEAHPSAGEAIPWPARRIDVTLDREVVGSPDWLRAFVRSIDGYEPLPLDPPTISTGPNGALTYSFAVAELPGDPPWEIVVQLRRPQVDAPSLDGGQWAFTAEGPDDPP